MDLQGEWIARLTKEVTMDIVYAAEKPSIASVFSDHISREVDERDIVVRHNPDETGSFLIEWNLHEFVMSPNGEVEAA
jgi:hypothetical protein